MYSFWVFEGLKCNVKKNQTSKQLACIVNVPCLGHSKCLLGPHCEIVKYYTKNCNTLIRLKSVAGKCTSVAR